MTDMTPMRIGPDRVTTEEISEVRSPFDGQVVGTVPVGTEAHLDTAVAAALARHRAGALPAYQRAEILDRAAAALADRREEFARSIATEAAKPIRTARVEAERAVDTFRFSAAVARTLAGEMVPLDASSAGRGEARVHPARPHRGGGRHLAVQLPPEPGGPQGGSGHRRGLSRGAQAGLGHAAHRPAAGVAAARRLRPARRLAQRGDVQRAHRQPSGHPRRRGHDHLHRLAAGGLGDPGRRAPQARRPGAGQQRAGGHRARRRLGRSGPQDQRGRLFVRRPVVHLGATRLRALVGGRWLHRRAGDRGQGFEGRRSAR